MLSAWSTVYIFLAYPTLWLVRVKLLFIYLTFFFLLLTFLPPYTEIPMSDTKLLQSVQATLPATVAVVAPRPQQLRGDSPQSGERPPCGAGVIIDASGIIVTNNHVIDGADPDFLEIITYDGKRHKAKLIGRSPSADVAVLEIKPFANMAVAPIGISDALLAG